MERTAFLGQGQMGAPMAARLAAAGHSLSVWNRTAARAQPLVAAGARLAATPADAARDAGVIITMLADPAALDSVLFGPGGVAAALQPGQILIEMSTVGPDAIRRAAARLPAGAMMIDAPVLGSVPQATDGSLKIFVGGPPEAFDRVSGLLGVMGHPIHVGPLGSGAAMKLVVNSTLGVLMSGVGEALALADALGLDPGLTLDVLADSPVGVTVRAKRTAFESGIYAPRFKLALAGKDLRLITMAAAGSGCELRLAPAARSWVEAAVAAGSGDLDYSAVVAHIRGLPALAPPPPGTRRDG